MDAEDRALSRRWQGYRRGRPLHLPCYKGFPVLEEFMAKLMPRERLPHMSHGPALLTAVLEGALTLGGGLSPQAVHWTVSSQGCCWRLPYCTGVLPAYLLAPSCPALFLSLSLFLAPFNRLCGKKKQNKYRPSNFALANVPAKAMTLSTCQKIFLLSLVSL